MRRLRRRLLLLLLAVLGIAAHAQSPPELVGRAQNALALGDYYAAIEDLRQALRDNPNYTDAILGLAEAYYWLGEYDQAHTFVERASRLARTSPRVLNLSARIAIGLGDLSGAEAAFERVREIEPNNVDAAIGRAELALARGQSAEAVASLERALRLNPEHRKALLSLVLIYEYMGEESVARRYLDLARSVHRDRPEVHVLAAHYFLRSGDYDDAARAARTAQAVDPLNRSAIAVRAEVALVQESYLEAVTVSEELIRADRNDVRAWYLRAVANHELGEIGEALTSIRTALRLEPENPMIRIWAEWLALTELEMDDEIRAELARARAEDARELERAFRYDRALKAYQRALQLAPFDIALRRDYAELYRTLGYNSSYLQELRLLLEEGAEDVSLTRTMEVFQSALEDSVARRWDVDQFTVARSRVPVALYLGSSAISGYPRIESALLSFLSRTMRGEERIRLEDSALVDGFAASFDRARSQDVLFFIQADAADTDRVFSVDAEILVARTGSLVGEASSVRSGPDNATAAADSLSLDLAAALPLRGSIIRRRGRAVVLDLGSRDGIETGATFQVVRSGAVAAAPNELGLVYSQDAVVGTATVTVTDDLVAEATLDRLGVVDRVTVGDTVILVPEENGEAADALGAGSARAGIFPILYEQVRRLR
ncbi:MAG: tetratricopeptide repeat protein [Spirochaetota bacterium]